MSSIIWLRLGFCEGDVGWAVAEQRSWNRVKGLFFGDIVMTAEVFQAITAGRAAIDGIKVLAQYRDDIKDVQKRGEFMRIIGELSVELAETQIRLAEKIRENDELKEEIKELKKDIDALKSPDRKLIIKNGLYFTSDEPDADGPFCTACFDSQHKTIRVTKAPAALRSLGEYKCPVCEAVYGG